MKRTYPTLLLLGLAGAFLAFGATGRAEDAPASTGPEITVTPTAQWISVDGNRQLFREQEGVRHGWSGGADEITLHHNFSEETSLDVAGRAIFDERDYQLQLALTKTDVGFLRAGFSQYRKYYDNTGGYFAPFSPATFRLSDNLGMDIGRIYFEAGLTLPDVPKITIGYERQYRDGNKSLLQWGSVVQGTDIAKIYPSAKEIDEHTDILTLSIEHEIRKVAIRNYFRYERFESDTRRANTAVNLNTATRQTVTIRENYDSDNFINTFHLSSHLNEKVFWSLGYLFTTLDGAGSLNIATPPPLGPFDRNWLTRALDTSLDSHVLNLNAMFGPYAGLVFYAGLQTEQTETRGLTDALFTTGLNPASTNLLRSSNDKRSLSETLGVRYTKIPYTTLYAEGRWTQQDIDLTERETENSLAGFARVTDTTVSRQDYRVGFNTAPIARVNLAGRYRHRIVANDYDHTTDTDNGYSAFITAQDFTTDEVMAKLTLRPCAQFSVALTYQLVATDIDTGHNGALPIAPQGTRQSGNYDAHIYSLSATVTPLTRLYLTGYLSFQDTRTTAFDNASPAVVAYEGNVYTVMGTAGYALNEKTDLTLEYTYSRADSFANSPAAGLPLGVDYQRHAILAGLSRKIRDNITARLRYGFYEYNETSSGGFRDYTAHLVSTTWTMRF